MSIPRKLRAWRETGVRFVILPDNDGGDRHRLKADLTALCSENKRDCLVRIACQKLEAWYLGEPEALADAFGDERLRRIRAKARYRNSDAVRYPSADLERLVPEFQKVSGARLLGEHLSRERNTSRSFQVLIEGLERVATTMRLQ